MVCQAAIGRRFGGHDMQHRGKFVRFGLQSAAAIAVGYAAVFVTIVTVAMLTAPDVMAGSRLSIFSGDWRGRGSLTLMNGKTERILCRMSVKTSDENRRARQLIQCASTGRDIIVRSSLSLSGIKVSGSYEEQVIGSQGSLNGVLKGNRLQLTMGGPDVSASIVTTATTTRQNVRVSGRVGTITRISIRMKRIGR